MSQDCLFSFEASEIYPKQFLEVQCLRLQSTVQMLVGENDGIIIKVLSKQGQFFSVSVIIFWPIAPWYMSPNAGGWGGGGGGFAGENPIGFTFPNGPKKKFGEKIKN